MRLADGRYPGNALQSLYRIGLGYQRLSRVRVQVPGGVVAYLWLDSPGSQEPLRIGPFVWHKHLVRSSEDLSDVVISQDVGVDLQRDTTVYLETMAKRWRVDLLVDNTWIQAGQP